MLQDAATFSVALYNCDNFSPWASTFAHLYWTIC